MAVTAAVRLGNLPVELTSFVGRGQDLLEVSRLLSGARLVTLTGTAGVGKSRLAARVGERVRARYGDGVWRADLADLRDGALLAHTVAHALGLRDTGGPDQLTLLQQFLAHRRLLLLLDNCEHLTQACAAFTQALLSTVPGVRVLATGRQALGVPGEQVVTVHPFEVGQGTELFAQRAAAVQPAFVIDATNRAIVADICRQLDGIPLAIELAAARLRALSVEQVRDRLDDRFRLLTNGQRGRAPRHRTLLAAVAWSFDLCEQGEQMLWARASVFAGGFDLDSARQVCGSPPIDGPAVPELVERLVGKSVLLRTEQDGQPRYRLPESLRQYGQDKLRGSGEADRLAAAHAAWYLELAERGERELFGPGQSRWWALLHREHDNLRAALEFFVQAPDPPAAQRLATALWYGWIYDGRTTEGRLWLERVLALPGEPSGTLAAALWAAAFVASQQSDLDTAADFAERALRMAVQVGDAAIHARVLHRLALLATYREDFDRARVLSAEAVRRYRALGEPAAPHLVLALSNVATLHLMRSDPAAAMAVLRQAVWTCEAHGDRLLLQPCLLLLASVEWQAGDTVVAAARARQVVGLYRVLPVPVCLAWGVETLAWFAGTGGDHERAAFLLGAADRIWRGFGMLGLRSVALFRVPHEACREAGRAELGETAFRAAFERGGTLYLDDIVRAATGEPPAPPAPAADSPSLTRREREVARLVAEGLSNKEIAGRLGISQRTAESHVEKILAKLDFGSRVQIAAWVAGGGM